MGGDPQQHRRDLEPTRSATWAADDIAWGVVYLASGESKFMTGSERVFDGGYIRR